MSFKLPKNIYIFCTVLNFCSLPKLLPWNIRPPLNFSFTGCLRRPLFLSFFSYFYLFLTSRLFWSLKGALSKFKLRSEFFELDWHELCLHRKTFIILFKLCVKGHWAHYWRPWCSWMSLLPTMISWVILFHENSTFQPWTFVCICEWKSSIENSQIILHGYSYVEFGWITPTKKKHCEWITFHGRNKIYMIFLGTLFHSKISWIFMDGLLFHRKGFDSTTFIKVDTKETWNLNSKPFNLLSICFKDVLKRILNFERALLKLQKAIWYIFFKIKIEGGKEGRREGRKSLLKPKKI